MGKDLARANILFEAEWKRLDKHREIKSDAYYWYILGWRDSIMNEVIQ